MLILWVLHAAWFPGNHQTQKWALGSPTCTVMLRQADMRWVCSTETTPMRGNESGYHNTRAGTWLSYWWLMSTGKAVFKPCQQGLSLHCCLYSGRSFILQVRRPCLPPCTPQRAEVLHFGSSFVITQVAICSQISRAEPTHGSSQPSGHEIQSLLACLSSS